LLTKDKKYRYRGYESEPAKALKTIITRTQEAIAIPVPTKILELKCNEEGIFELGLNE